MIRIQKCASKILSVIFLSVALFGIYACVGMSLSMMLPEQMVSHHGALEISDHCILVMSQETCSWNIAQHLEHWQNTFLFSLLSDAVGLLVLLPMLFFFSSRFGFAFLFLFHQNGLERYKLYRRVHREFRLYYQLLTFFSRGILHTKIYA